MGSKWLNGLINDFIKCTLFNEVEFCFFFVSVIL